MGGWPVTVLAAKPEYRKGPSRSTEQASRSHLLQRSAQSSNLRAASLESTPQLSELRLGVLVDERFRVQQLRDRIIDETHAEAWKSSNAAPHLGVAQGLEPCHRGASMTPVSLPVIDVS